MAGGLLRGRFGRPIRGGVLPAAAVLLAGSAITVALTSAGYPQGGVSVQTGQVWLASPTVGQMALVDGSTGDVVTQVKVAGPGPVWSVAQLDANAVVGDARGRVSRVDGATWRVSTGQPPLGGGQVRLVAGAADVVAVNGAGEQVRINPRTLRPVEAPSKAGRQIRVDTAISDGADGVWALATDGVLWRLGAGSPRRTGLTTAAAGAGAAVSTIGAGADRRVVVADPAAGKAYAVDGEGDVTAFGCMPLAAPVVAAGSTGSDSVVAASSASGEFVVTRLGDNSCSDQIRLATGGADFGVPVEVGGRVFVPDRRTGRVHVVDVAAARLIASPAVLPKGSAGLGLIARDGVVFFNDQRSERAGIVRLDGTLQAVAKYSARSPAKDLAGSEQDNEESDQPGKDDPESNPAPARSALTVRMSEIPAVAGRVTGLIVTSVNGPVTTATWSFGDGSAAASGPSVSHNWRAPGRYRLTVRAGSQTWAGSIEVVAPSNAGPPPDVGRQPGGPTGTPSSPPVEPGAGSSVLTVDVQGQGIVTAQPAPARGAGTCTSTCDFTYPTGTTIMLHAEPDTRPGAPSGTRFTGWTGACAGTGDCQVVLNAARAVKAGFRSATAKLTVNPSSGEAPLEVTADAGDSSGFPEPIRYAYDWGDGAADFDAGTRQAHTYRTEGSYTITVTVTGADGTTGTATAGVTAEGCTPTVTSLNGPDTVESDKIATFTATGRCLTKYLWTWEGPEGSFGSDDQDSTFGFNAHTEGTYTVRVTAMNGNRSGTSRSASIEVTDDAPEPVVAIGGNPTFPEGSDGPSSRGNRFTVRLSRASTETVRVDYRTQDRGGGATEGTDYVSTSGTLVFDPGETSKTVPVTIIGDTVDEPNESFGFVISNPVNAALGFSSAYGAIVDDDS